MDLTNPDLAITQSAVLAAPQNGTSAITCTLIGIDWNTGKRTCVNANGYVLLIVVLVGVIVAMAMLCSSFRQNDADNASRVAIYRLEEDPFRMFANWLGWPGDKLPEDQRKRKERQETRNDSVLESRPLLHRDEESWCDYCTLVEQRRESQLAEYGCNV
ncbi:MAG: hypothetical protein M1821_003788 [Bathelium mastoideum]|nr:MAG: hypothetical protein M1821_003788 [Bathelium mastoideum]KAI9690867.1 MAG: hypothetical protein M1822_008486 [Bathelium mastoideum]